MDVLGFIGGNDFVARLQTNGGEDIAFLTVWIVDEGNVAGTVGIVFKTNNGAWQFANGALEVDEAEEALVAATTMTDGDATGVVATGEFGIDQAERLDGAALTQMRALERSFVARTGSDGFTG